MAAGDHHRPDHQRTLPGAPRRRSVRTLWERHYPRGCQDAGTRAGLLRVAIHGIRCIHPEARGKGTRELPQNCQETRRKTRHARGRNWARRDRDELLQLRARFRLCRRRIWRGFDAGPRPRRPRRLRSQRRAPAPFDSATDECKQMFTQRIRRSIGLAVHRGWAKLLLDRCRDLFQDPRQPRTHTREADEDDAEAHEYFHFHQTRGRGGHHRTRQG